MVKRVLGGAGFTAFWPEGDNTYKPEMDDNWRKASVMLGQQVLSRTTALPGSPTPGDIYIDPGDDSVNVWDGEVGSEAWVSYPPAEGWMFFVVDDNERIEYKDGSWQVFQSGGGSVTVTALAGGFRAVRSASNQTITPGVETVVLFDAEAFDSFSAYDPTTGLFTVPAQLDGSFMSFSAGGRTPSADAALFSIERDGVKISQMDGHLRNSQLQTGIVQVSTGQIFRVVVTDPSGTDVAADERSYFSGTVYGENPDSFVFSATINETSTNFAPDASHKGQWVELENAAGITVTLNTGVFQKDDEVTFEQKGAGIVTFVAGPGFVLRSRDNSFATTGQYAVATVKFKSATEAVLVGDVG